MKKLSVFGALALLAVAGTGYAVTCSQDNVPAATLLVPHFRVAASIDPATGNIASPSVDTLCAVTNVSGTGLIAHVTVWNKYSAPVFDFNVPMSGYDVVTFRMSDLLNGKLNVNGLTQDPAKVTKDLCGIKLSAPASFTPTIGFGKTTYIRFTHPDYTGGQVDFNTDYARSISIYAAQAFGTGAFRPRVWDSLDESGNVTSFSSPSAGNVIDAANPACVTAGSPRPVSGAAFTGYVTIDVVNFCTNWFPDNPLFYNEDAIATRGWRPYGYTPNALIGDVFYVDSAASGGNISGDPMVHVEYDERLAWDPVNPPKTFYGRYVYNQTTVAEQTAAGEQNPAVPASFRFGGDGREPLAEHYGFRFMNSAPAAQSWIIVWRSSLYKEIATDLYNQYNLCDWWYNGPEQGYGLWDDPHKLVVFTYDEDENLFAPSGQGCPSGDPNCVSNPNDLYIFLESSRIALAGNTEFNPSGYPFGWVDMTLYNGITDNYWNQGFVGVQHSAQGQFVSVGHSATVLDGGSLCYPQNSTFINPNLDGINPSKPLAGRVPTNSGL